MFHKEGFRIIIIALFLVIGLSLLANTFITSPTIRGGILIAFLIGLLLLLQFFRNPKSNFIVHPDYVLSPVDGKIAVIEEAYEKDYFKDRRLLLSVFMSPVAVHV